MLKKNNAIFKSGKITVYIYIVVISLIIGGVILGLTTQDKANKYKEEAVNTCISLCKLEIAKGTILNSGPCISNSVAPGWVCDIVSSPRNKLIDDLSDNQCEAYRNGTIKHFVELTPECNFVRAD